MQKKSVVEKYVVDIYERKLSDFKFSAGEKWAIYGSGNGAEVVFKILKKWNLDHIITAIIDNDDVVEKKGKFHGFSITSLEENYELLDGIIIASMDYHEIVYERVLDQLRTLDDNHLKIVNLFGHNTEAEVREYVDYIGNLYKFRCKDIFEDFDDKGVKLKEQDTKVIAWYLPQYHRIDINDKYYGRGFTEWTNTTKAIPMFTGHHQPHIPYDLGYYSLNDPEIFQRQIELAKHYGIYGFSFYYYWFSGKRIMERPLEYFLNHSNLDIKFCITWANENWSALWDGSDNNLIYKQELNENDDYKFIDDLLPYFHDNRYITINGKKAVIIYRTTVWRKERVIRLFSNMRYQASKRGIGDLYIIICNARGFDEDVEEWGADALVEFPPHGIGAYTPVIRFNGYLNPSFVGHIRSTDDFINNKKYLCEHKSNVFFRGAMPSWDNTSRKAYDGATVYTGLTPKTFKQWMSDIVRESCRIHSIEENYVFVNAWNEWAEGSHLEPDMMYGYANLIAVREAIENARNHKRDEDNN